MNAAQNRAAGAIARAALEKSGSKAEIKEWECRPLSTEGRAARYLWVRIVVGMTGDEGTAAEFFCRYRGFFCVGPRGGIEARSRSKHATKANVEKYPLIFGFES